MRKSIKEFNLISNNVLEIKVYYFNSNVLYIVKWNNNRTNRSGQSNRFL